MIIGLSRGRPTSRVKLSYSMERHGVIPFYFEDHLQCNIDDVEDMNDNERKEYIKRNLHKDFIFSSLKSHIEPLKHQYDIVIPHVTTLKQSQFIKQLGGTIINIDDPSSLATIAKFIS
jgi:hypothetical protein